MMIRSLLLTCALLGSLSACQSGGPVSQLPIHVQSQSARVVYHVLPNGGNGWQVKEQRASAPVSTHRTKEEAVAAGRAAAQRHALSQLVIHKANGQIETEYTYGKDPASAG
ncbi:MAG: DUF2188 domain-containing protein [Candidatus Sericytochromatia bacterium]